MKLIRRINNLVYKYFSAEEVLALFYDYMPMYLEENKPKSFDSARPKDEC